MVFASQRKNCFDLDRFVDRITGVPDGVPAQRRRTQPRKPLHLRDTPAIPIYVPNTLGHRGTLMPMQGRMIAWFVGFALAVALAAWMRSEDYGWLASLGAAAVALVVISQIFSTFVLWRMQRKTRGMDENDE